MNKIRLIACREFSIRIRKRSFKLMTILGPLLFAALLIVPVWLKSSNDRKAETIFVVDHTGSFTHKLAATEKIFFAYANIPLEEAKIQYLQGNFEALLFIPASGKMRPSEIVLFSKKKMPVRTIQYIESAVNTRLYGVTVEDVLKDHKIDAPIQNSSVQIKNESLFDSFGDDTGNSAAAIGLFGAILIYFFILLYGLQVMRGVMEEKNSRVVEVLIASLKPFELMLGKILGVAMVSMMQFTIWIAITAGTAFIFAWRFGKSVSLFTDEHIGQTLKNSVDPGQALEINELINSFHGFEPYALLFSFFIFFICGYLLYSALFAAIGAIVDSETDIQQFLFPVTLPLFFSFMLISVIMEQPHGNLAVSLSIIPLTSPVIMMVRLPYGVPFTELFISVLVLICTFLFSTWGASKIYRTGILMHGKKISYVDMFKWVFAKK